jgi:hypothetical protein
MQTALLDVTMDRMEPEIQEEFEEIDNGARTALAFLNQTGGAPALALLTRYAARHARDYHRALDKLRQIQKERSAAPIQNHDRKGVVSISPNEPNRPQPQPNQQPPRPIALAPSPPAADSRPPGGICG